MLVNPPWNTLLHNLLEESFVFLEPQDLNHSRLVCRYWCEAASSDKVWKVSAEKIRCPLEGRETSIRKRVYQFLFRLTQGSEFIIQEGIPAKIFNYHLPVPYLPSSSKKEILPLPTIGEIQEYKKSKSILTVWKKIAEAANFNYAGNLVRFDSWHEADQKAEEFSEWWSRHQYELRTITELDLQKSELTFLPPEIVNLAKLSVLHLADNQLETVPPWIGQLTHLKTLSLFNNPLKDESEVETLAKRLPGCSIIYQE